MQKDELHSMLRDNGCKIVIQFDGKCYPRLNERHVGTNDRIIVLCHTVDGDIPLGLFIVESHSALNCAVSILNSIKMHNLQNRIVGMVSDTERVNTGRIAGVCALIERDLKKPLLRLMCRHHVFELILKSAYDSCFGSSTGPCITKFDVLKRNWDHLKRIQFQYTPLDRNKMRNTKIKYLAEEAMRIIGPQIDHFRNDYAELNDLVLKFLGFRTNVIFKVPGAANNARWMARAIYALKYYMFREHLNLHEDFANSLERFCTFVALIYTKYWNQCSNAADAPFNDLQLLKELKRYHQVDTKIADTAMQAFQRHLWYLSDELITLALFSDKVSNDEKSAIAIILTEGESTRTTNSIRYTDIFVDIQAMELRDFVSERSFFLLNILEINTEFLSMDPSEWNDNESYKKAKKTVHDLIVTVNDSAERSLQFGADLISNQRIQTEERLQNFIVSSSYKK